jgi:hypothetical protein
MAVGFCIQRGKEVGSFFHPVTRLHEVQFNGCSGNNRTLPISPIAAGLNVATPVLSPV